jgi:hypothetical protein
MGVEGIHTTGCCPVSRTDRLRHCYHHLSALQPSARCLTPWLRWTRALFAVLRIIYNATLSCSVLVDAHYKSVWYSWTIMGILDFGILSNLAWTDRSERPNLCKTRRVLKSFLIHCCRSYPTLPNEDDQRCSIFRLSFEKCVKSSTCGELCTSVIYGKCFVTWRITEYAF